MNKSFGTAFVGVLLEKTLIPMKRTQLLLMMVVCFAVSSVAFAQSGRLRAANRQFENMSYLSAIRLYEEYMRLDKKKEPAERKEALTKLGYSYRRMQDSRNAERVYEDLIKEYDDLESESYLYYAQALAQNGKHRDSQKMYSKYGEMQAADLRGRRFTVAYMDVSRFYQDSSSYKVDYLPINSRQSDFSPMFYKNGLVFVSAREEGGAVKRVFSYNQTPFLDLYFAPDTAELHRSIDPTMRSTSTAGLGGALTTNQVLENASKEEQPLSKTEIFSRTLNTKYHEGPMTFFKGEEKIIFTRNNYNKGRSNKSSEGINKLKLYTSDYQKNSWGNVKELPFNSNEYSCGHPALSPDNTRLYFVSDMPGGFGGTDVYVVEYRNGEWGTPVNLGKEINSEGNEMFPFVDESNNLYFASDGHEGLGGLDLFTMELKEGIPMGQPINMGFPINSDKDDFGFICNRDRTLGYLSSNRKRGLSDDNLYMFRRSCKIFNLMVYDAESKQPIEASDVKILKNGESKELKITGMDGKVSMCLDANTEYEFKAIKEGYLTNSVKYSTRSMSKHQTEVSIYLERTKGTLVRGIVKSELTQKPIAGAKVTLLNEKEKTKQSVITGEDGSYEFNVKPNANHKILVEKDKYATNVNAISKMKSGKGPKVIENEVGLYGEGEVYKIENIYYDLNQFFIRPDAAKQLDEQLIPALKKNPYMKIEIRSHTDARSSDTYNLRLSENRARAVIGYLKARGIDPKRLIAKGYGEKELINDCGNGVECAEDQHQMNRRTEFKIIAAK